MKFPATYAAKTTTRESTYISVLCIVYFLPYCLSCFTMTFNIFMCGLYV